jgi:hypothetical protein
MLYKRTVGEYITFSTPGNGNTALITSWFHNVKIGQCESVGCIDLVEGIAQWLVLMTSNHIFLKHSGRPGDRGSIPGRGK